MAGHIKHIRRASRLIAILAGCFMLLIPLSCIAYWASFNVIAWPFPNAIAGLVHKPLSVQALMIGFLCSALPTGLLMYGVFQVRQLFRLYAREEMFTTANCVHLRRLGYAMLAWLPLSMVFDAVLSVAVSMSNPPGQHYLSISVHTVDVVILFIGAVFVVLAWVMGEGARIAEEQSQFV